MAKKQENAPKEEIFLSKINYQLMALGFILIVVGFILMVGGQPPSPDVFNPEVFSFRRITLAPLMILLGYALELYAVMRKPKS